VDPLRLVQVGPDQLHLYASIPISFWVERVLRVQPVDGGLGGLCLVEEPVPEPYLKDYDNIEMEDPDQERPTRWPTTFDVSNWAFFLAFHNDTPVGGAAVAFDSPGVNMLEGRRDLAVLWDIRVHPGHRGQGVGSALFRRAAEWARSRNCRQLKIETQNINVPACRFYAAMGCHLGVINRYAYLSVPSIAHEVMLLWYLDLT
jgi:GNAT superfamily N-acetyltransferase